MARKPTSLFVPFTLALLSAGAVIVATGLSATDARQYYNRVTSFIGKVTDPPSIDVQPPSIAVENGKTPLAAALALSNVRPSIETYAAPPPDGWLMRASQDDDYETMLGVPPIDWEVENPAIADIESEMMDHLARQSQVKTRDRGVETARVTYQNGASMIMLWMQYVPDYAFEGAGGAEFGLLQELMRDLCATEYGAAPFASVAGVPFAESPIAGAPQGRRFTAVIEPQIDIELWTNADDAVLEAVLNGLDIPSLRALTQS